jgi:hypothetical protein
VASVQGQRTTSHYTADSAEAVVKTAKEIMAKAVDSRAPRLDLSSVPGMAGMAKHVD